MVRALAIRPCQVEYFCVGACRRSSDQARSSISVAIVTHQGCASLSPSKKAADKMKDKSFATEVELCSRFVAQVDQKEWGVYAETQGWDLLLVRREDGFQIGIQAKLKLNLKVIDQTIEYRYSLPTTPGPDCRAILVPDTETGFEDLCAYIGLTVIRVKPKSRWWPKGDFDPDLPTIKNKGWRDDWHEWCPTVRHKLPEYVPDVLAGAPSPTQLTDWKIKAMKIAIIVEKRGYVTRQDFKTIGIDHRRWLKPASWLVVEDGHYVRGHMPDFKSQHPTVWEQISADFEKWAPKETPVPMTQATLV